MLPSCFSRPHLNGAEMVSTTALSTHHTSSHHLFSSPVVPSRNIMQELQPSSSQPPRPASFLGVALEIRHEIYRYCLVKDTPVNLHFADFDPDEWLEVEPDDFYEYLRLQRRTSLLRVSKQISEEALDLLYGETVFELPLHDGKHNILSKFAPHNQRRIRRLQLVLKPKGISYGSPLQLDSLLWQPILANVTRLTIVAEEPEKQSPPSYDIILNNNNTPSYYQQLNEWVAWLRPILAYLNQNITSGRVTNIDDKGKELTRQVFNECFTGRCRAVETWNRDVYFKRRAFGCDSGYWDDEYSDTYADSWSYDSDSE